MKDHIINTSKLGGICFWEEIARDGAQSKTIMNGNDRSAFANKHASLFNYHAHKHLIFAAGFPSAGVNEFNAIREMVEKVSDCYLATHARPTKNDIDISIDALKGAKYSRLSFLIPTSESKAKIIMKTNLKTAFNNALELIDYTKSKVPDIPLDIALVDCPTANPEILCDFLNTAQTKGLSISKICDSRGLFYPNSLNEFYKRLTKNLSDDVNLGVHFHNDLALAVWNTMNMISKGIRIISSSWLGLGERSGLISTEQILFLLLFDNDKLERRFGISNPEKLFSEAFNIKEIVPLAKEIAEHLNVPIKSTEPIIGSGLNSISTGLPFVKPLDFQPFDPEVVLGVKREVHITHLASKKVVDFIAKQNHYNFDSKQLEKILEIIKSRPYNHKKPILDKNEIIEIFNNV